MWPKKETEKRKRPLIFFFYIHILTFTHCLELYLNEEGFVEMSYIDHIFKSMFSDTQNANKISHCKVVAIRLMAAHVNVFYNVGRFKSPLFM